jgi:hypothetical protein
MKINDIVMSIEKETAGLSVRAAQTQEPTDLVIAYATKCEAWRRWGAVLVGIVNAQSKLLKMAAGLAVPAADNIADDPWIRDLGREFTIVADIAARERAGRDQ